MEEKIPGLADGKTLKQYLAGETADVADFKRQIIDKTTLSPAFCDALTKYGKTTLLVYSFLSCPDCRAVIPVIAKIPSINPNISIVMADWTLEARDFLKERLGTGRAPTVLALDAEGRLKDGAFIERPLEVHRATAGAATKREAVLVIDAFRNGNRNTQIEDDLLKLLDGEKTDVLHYLR